MRASAARSAFLLLLALTVCALLYVTFSSDVTPDRERPAGGDLKSPQDSEVNWIINSTAQQEEEDEVVAPCSLRNAVRNAVLLRDRFNFSVPVLQWAGSLTGPAWRRLRTRAPPYGWKGLPVDVLGSALSPLSGSRLFARGSPGRCVRCAVVGNGGILRGSRQGADIDRHDLVFRMNGAVIEGFEEDVGTKVSFYGFTTNTMKNALVLYRRDGFTRVPQSPDVTYIFIPSNLRDYVMMAAALQGRTVSSGEDEGDRPWKYFGHKPPENFKILHPDFITYLAYSFLPSHLLFDFRTRHLYMPSTGALMLLTAIHTCDQVSAYGFITRDFAAFSDHYYDSWRRPLRFFSNHDLQLERRLWAELHHGGVVRLYQRGAPL